MAQQKNNTQEQDINQLLKVRREKLADLQANGKNPFEITKYDVTYHTADAKAEYEAHETEILAGREKVNVDGLDEQQARDAINQDYNERRAIMDAAPINVSIAGRMMFKRVMGKASFCNIQDLKGNIQVYVARDSVGEDKYADFKKSDIGDIFGVEGFLFRTKTGEISIHASNITMLSKSLQILPEKYHGMTNTDLRYRQRYTDLIMNPEVKETFIKRSKIIKEIRNFLDARDFMEVETPMLVSNAGGAAALSILTDEHFFGGTLKDIKAVRPLIQLPILRKDFIIDEHQLYEARLTGADAVLLIAACLTVDRCCELASMAHAMGLEVLLEVHSEEELPYVCCQPDMLGVNNRNLGTFVTDVQNSFRMAEALKQTIGQATEAPLLVSESGLSKPKVVLELREAGYRGFLMGEAFMKEILPGMALKRFTKALRS